MFHFGSLHCKGPVWNFYIPLLKFIHISSDWINFCWNRDDLIKVFSSQICRVGSDMKAFSVCILTLQTLFSSMYKQVPCGLYYLYHSAVFWYPTKCTPVFHTYGFPFSLISFWSTVHWNPEGSRKFFTVYPDLSPITDIVPFLKKGLLSFFKVFFELLSAAASVFHKIVSTF